MLFTATDPAGPWSDGLPIEGITGIDPDLAWDEDGTTYVTYSGLDLTGAEIGHQGIRQVRIDLATGQATEAPRALWSGTGLQFPEAPHLYRRGEHWYLVHRGRGHRAGPRRERRFGPSPEGPFEPHPANPILSARSTGWAVRRHPGHAGHRVETPDGGSALVLLGMRPCGAARAYSPLGRETFITPVAWEDGLAGCPTPLARLAGPGVEEAFALDDPGHARLTRGGSRFSGPAGTRFRGHRRRADSWVDGGAPSLESMWRRTSSAVASVISPHGGLRHGSTATAGAGGLACRSDDQHWFGLELHGRTGHRHRPPGLVVVQALGDGNAGRRGRAAHRDSDVPEGVVDAIGCRR